MSNPKKLKRVGNFRNKSQWSELMATPSLRYLKLNRRMCTSSKNNLQTSVIYLIWMPSHVEINSLAQLMMIFRAMRPLRIYTLVPHIRRVVVELCKGFKEILLVPSFPSYSGFSIISCHNTALFSLLRLSLALTPRI